jgi:hypothetical protein
VGWRRIQWRCAAVREGDIIGVLSCSGEAGALNRDPSQWVRGESSSALRSRMLTVPCLLLTENATNGAGNAVRAVEAALHTAQVEELVIDLDDFDFLGGHGRNDGRVGRISRFQDGDVWIGCG